MLIEEERMQAYHYWIVDDMCQIQDLLAQRNTSKTHIIAHFCLIIIEELHTFCPKQIN